IENIAAIAPGASEEVCVLVCLVAECSGRRIEDCAWQRLPHHSRCAKCYGDPRRYFTIGTDIGEKSVARSVNDGNAFRQAELLRRLARNFVAAGNIRKLRSIQSEESEE